MTVGPFDLDTRSGEAAMPRRLSFRDGKEGERGTFLKLEVSSTQLGGQVILGQVQRVYKNLPPTVRLFFLTLSQLHGDKVAVVFEQERLTYNELRERAVKAAAILHDVCGVTKGACSVIHVRLIERDGYPPGDRVALCSRNFPEFLVIFWATR